jgi:hypothetical protein
MGDQMLQRIASNLSNCNLHLMFVSDTEKTSVRISRSLDDPIGPDVRGGSKDDCLGNLPLGSFTGLGIGI